MESEFHRRFTKKVEEEANSRSNGLLAGNASDYAEYKRGVGVLEGLRAAQKLADDVDFEMHGGAEP